MIAAAAAVDGTGAPESYRVTRIEQVTSVALPAASTVWLHATVSSRGADAVSGAIRLLSDSGETIVVDGGGTIATGF